MKNLLIEYLPFTPTKMTINESSDKTHNGNLIVSGVLQRANAPNQNKRVYPRHILERETSKYLSNEVASRRALGELDHPESSVVNLKNVSHNILSMEWKGDDLIGTIEILNTPSGNILKELFKSKITLGISSRGVGSVNNLNEDEGTVEIQDDFELICFDFVSNPSTHGAFQTPVGLNESKNVEIKKNTAVDILIRDIICELSGVCCI
jgi:hypothetical protein